MVNVNKLKPNKLNVSDKYSSNLYKFLKKNPNHTKVYFENRDAWDGSEMQLDWNNICVSQIVIGSDVKEGGSFDCIVGKSLASIVQGRKLNELYAITYHESIYTDITEEFWSKYEQIGRCLFFNHDSWIQGDENRFRYIGEDNIRECRWCGKIQELKLYKKEIECREWV